MKESRSSGFPPTNLPGAVRAIRRAAKYIADELKNAGAKPVNGSYFQNVKLVGTSKTNPQTKLSVGDASYNFGDDWVGFSDAQKPQVAVNAEIVFMGYGIDAPLYKMERLQRKRGGLSRKSFDDSGQRSARDRRRAESFRRQRLNLFRTLDL
jgi:hypothetical protein